MPTIHPLQSTRSERLVIGSTLGHPAARAQPSEVELRARYASYRRRQARGLLRLVPREAIRPLYRRALATLAPGPLAPAETDSMETLLAYCERLLPLPPFESWLADVGVNPDAHLHDVDDSADAPGADAPVTVETRGLSLGDHSWDAHLRSFRDGDVWRGFIAFEDRRSHRVHRTALIFRESDPVDVRDRFLGFEASALAAFLRSALP
jgi:hypothetical protein